MLAMWALGISSPYVMLYRATNKGLLEGLEGKPNDLPMGGIPTLGEALRGRWDRHRGVVDHSHGKPRLTR